MKRGTGRLWCTVASLVLVACSGAPGTPEATGSARRLAGFVETGDTTLLRGVFTDSVLKLMSFSPLRCEGPLPSSGDASLAVMGIQAHSCVARLDSVLVRKPSNPAPAHPLTVFQPTRKVNYRFLGKN